MFITIRTCCLFPCRKKYHNDSRCIIVLLFHNCVGMDAVFCLVWFFFSFVSFLSGLYSSSGIYSRSIFKIKSLFNYIYSLFGYLRLLSNAHDFNDSNRHRPSRILYCMMYGVVQKEPPSTVYDGSSFPWNYLVVCE